MERGVGKESFGEKVRAMGLALGLHAVVVLALLLGLWWTHESKPVLMPGPIIEATLVGPTAAPKARSGSTKPTPPKPVEVPKPEPPKPEAPKPEPEPAPAPPKPEPKPEPPAPKPAKETPAEVPHNDQVDQDKIAAMALLKAENEKKEQEEKRKARQVLLDEQQKEKDLKDQQDKKLKEEQQKELAEIRKLRDVADKKAKLEREKLAQLEDRNQRKAAEPEQEASPGAEQEAPRAQTGANGEDGLAARYSAAIQVAVKDGWNRPDSAQAGLRCALNIVQIPGGEVISVTVGSPCNADPATRNSIEQAVMKASPLPYQGYEKVFQRSATLNFRYDG